MAIGYVINPYFSNHQRVVCISFMQSYNVIKKKHSNKKEKEPEEIKVTCQHFHSSFHLMIFTYSCYYFGPNNTIFNYDSLTAPRWYPVDQVPPPLVIRLDDNWDTIGRNRHVRVSQSVDGSNKHFCSVILWLHQRRIQLNILIIFWRTGMRITHFDKKSYKVDVPLF